MRLENIRHLPRRAVVAATALTVAALFALSPGDAGAEYGLIATFNGQPSQTAATVTSDGGASGETEGKQLKRPTTRRDFVGSN